MNAVEEIKHLYYNATRATIQKDLARAIDLLKSLANEEERERVAVYMDGLSQMRSEWSAANRSPASHRSGSSRSAFAPPGGAPRGRSGRSTASSRRHR